MPYFSPDSINIGDYDYNLPDHRIARFPLEERSSSKLLVYDKGKISHTTFRNIVELPDTGGLMIFNNTRVIQARIIMYKSSGARIEIFLLEPVTPPEYNTAFSAMSRCTWKCMVGNKKKWKGGKLTKQLDTEGKNILLECEVVEDNGSWQEIEFKWEPAEVPFSIVIDNAGLTPIPPYLNRMPVEADKTTYQTVYSKFDGSVAAPTAGLHFTAGILKEFEERGTVAGEITLHVGAGTFQPVKSHTAGGHPMHTEHFSVTLEELIKIRNNLGNITAVGTTSVRTLESLYHLGVKQLINAAKPADQYQETKHPAAQQLNHAAEQTRVLSQWEYMQLPSDIAGADALDALLEETIRNGSKVLEAKTEMMIIPGYKFRIVNKMITNFHQPGSTLLLLIAAFIGRDWHRVYDYALNNDFRFLSYGDSSLLIP